MDTKGNSGNRNNSNSKKAGTVKKSKILKFEQKPFKNTFNNIKTVYTRPR
jgi:hypothetical protein